MSEIKANVPKFASFRPKPTQEPETKSKDQDDNRHSSKSKSTKERKSNHHKRHRSRSRDSTHTHERTETTVSRAAPVLEANFVIDRKGDVKNLVYGSIHRYDVPVFYRYGAGYILGGSRNLRIDRDLDDGKSITLRNSTLSRSGGREKYVFSRIEKERPRLLRIRPQATVTTQEDETDFVPLQPRGQKRKRGGDGAGLSSDSEQDDKDYRSIYGTGRSQDQPPDPDFQYATESDGSGSDAGRNIGFDVAAREKSVMLSRKVEESPEDVDAWQELIDHQDSLLHSAGDGRRVTNAELRSTAEIKIHMYEKALEKSKHLKDRERLLHGLMEEGAKIWDTKTQADRWEEISKENIDSLNLWTNYLNFKQSALSSFRYEEIKGIYSSRLKLLLTTIEKSNGDHVDALHKQIIYVLLRLTLFIRESGYAELSIAIWQGLLEVNLCGPSTSLSDHETTTLFQQFWESEVPRLGESGALGWRRYVEQEDSSAVPESTTDLWHDTLQTSHIFKSWATGERQHSKSAQMPARTMDEVAEDDPYRVILFSDIEACLIIAPSSLRSLYVDAFLIFCGLPPTASRHEEPRTWYTDQFIRNELLFWAPERIEENLPKIELDGDIVYGLKPAFQVIYSDTLESTVSTSKVNALRQTLNWRNTHCEDGGPVPYQFVRQAIKQLTQTSFTEELAQYHMNFEYANEPAGVKKIAKGLLKQYPSNLRLYNTYALIEWSGGNKEVAKGVFSAALSMNGSESETDSDPDSILLWRSLIWCCLEDGDRSLMLKHMWSIPDGVPNTGARFSPSALLRVKNHLTSSRDFLLSSGDPAHAALYEECLVLLIYLTSIPDNDPSSHGQGDITTALDTITSFSETLASRDLTYHQELFLQFAARLLIYHCKTGPYRPSLVRTHLTNFLTLFPSNTLFLSLYTANEARLRVDNRVRSLFISTILTPENDCLTSRLFAIQYEMHYGTIHSVKSAFEKAVSSPPSCSSPGLWKFYLIWLSQNQKQLSKNGKQKSLAKDVWHRALRACPWAKELYVLGFELFGENSGTDFGMDFKELRSTWRIMGEKELRVHGDLEEEFEDIEESQKQKMIGR